MTPKELLWQQYYAAVKARRHDEAREILAKIHKGAPTRTAGRAAGCSRCKKRF